jgi:hypothetical protein
MAKLIFVFLLFFIKIPFDWSQAENDLSNYKHPEFAQLDSGIREKKSLINFDCNQFAFFSEKSTNWLYLYAEMQKMISKKDRKLNFYHIGGSHIQADIYTHDFRTFLQSNWPGLNGERGLVFPFGLASTNNPSNYNF